MSRLIPSIVVSVLAASVACAPGMHPRATQPLSSVNVDEFWEPPADFAGQDVFWGPWGEKYAPQPGQTYKYVDEKTGGFSLGYDVVDDNGVQWTVKEGPEANVEVVVSRILSAVGYHQPPVYYVPNWSLRGGNAPHDQKPGRFRPKLKDLKAVEPWSWQKNPFVDAPSYRGLIALMMLLNGTDLKNDNNMLYELSEPQAGSDAMRWYVVRDVGAALGETGILSPQRGNPQVFEKTLFIKRVKDGWVEFDYHGRHKELVTHNVRPSDVRWMADLVSHLTEDQWRDAFRAGGYGPDVTSWYLKEIEKRLAKAQSMAAN